MARNVASTVENNFINGFVTEATALNFPEAAATDQLNCIFNLKGSITRRKGFNYEEDYTTTTKSLSDKALTSYYWRAAGGSGDWNFLVTQIGSDLLFYLTNSSSLSAGLSVNTVSILPFIVSGASNVEKIECQFSSGHGYLFVTHPNLEPFYVAYDIVSKTFSSNQISIKIRDFDGVSDGLNFDIGHRPPQASENNQYKYNLYNRGWAPFDAGGVVSLNVASTVTIPPPAGNVIGDPYQTWKNGRTDLPSYADVWWLYKDSVEQFQPKLASGMMLGNTPAPQGRYILDAFHQDRSAESGISGLPVVTSGEFRPSTVAFFAGRAWYAGVNTSSFSNKVYFSQIVHTEKEFGKCYQTNDPTSEHLFDLLPNDGGVITILDCGTIIKLWSIQSNLIVFATNGVWAISGNSGIGFTANDFSVRKVSSIPSISPSSFVDLGGTPSWWNSDGIYVISGADAVGQISITSLTERKVKTFFDDIPVENKVYVKGAFNSLTKVIQWVFKTTEESTLQSRYEYDTILCFNTLTQAFYFWTFPQGTYKLNGISCIQSRGSDTVLENVVTADSIVTSAGPVNVQVNVTESREIAAVFKYYISTDLGTGGGVLSFAEERDESYLDFSSEDYFSFFTSGYRVHGDAQKKYQGNYVILYMDNTSTNKFQFQGIWDYANSPNFGEFDIKQYIDTTGSQGDFVFRRLKIRGSGMSLQFKVSSITGEPFDIVGWSVFESGNARP